MECGSVQQVKPLCSEGKCIPYVMSRVRSHNAEHREHGSDGGDLELHCRIASFLVGGIAGRVWEQNGC